MEDFFSKVDRNKFDIISHEMQKKCTYGHMLGLLFNVVKISIPYAMFGKNTKKRQTLPSAAAIRYVGCHFGRKTTTKRR